MTAPPETYERFPGLRDHSGEQGSHGGHGIIEILDVIGRLSTVDIPSCVVGVKALRYYGAARITDVRPLSSWFSESSLADGLAGMGSLCP
jgi:hypothetical protein